MSSALPWSAVGVLLKHLHEPDAAAVRHVPPIREDVHPYPLRPALASTLEQQLQLVEPGVHASVAEQADEVQSAVLEGLLDVLETFALVYLPGTQRQIDQFRALRVYLSRSERIVADLAVPHVVVRRQPHRRPVRLDEPPSLRSCLPHVSAEFSERQAVYVT